MASRVLRPAFNESNSIVVQSELTHALVSSQQEHIVKQMSPMMTSEPIHHNTVLVRDTRYLKR